MASLMNKNGTMENDDKKLESLTAALMRIGVYRWEAVTLFFCAAVVGIIIYGVIPTAIGQWKEYRILSQTFSWKKQLLTASQQIAAYKNQSLILDSLIHKINQFLPYSESGILQTIYSSADSNHLVLSKVEIQKPVRVAQRNEVPMTIEGAGTYHGLAHFISDLENSGFIVRMRQLSIIHMQGDSGSMMCDAIIADTISLNSSKIASGKQ